MNDHPKELEDAVNRGGKWTTLFQYPGFRAQITWDNVKEVVAWIEDGDTNDEDDYGYTALLLLNTGVYAVLTHYNEGMTPGYPSVCYSIEVYRNEQEAVQFGLEDDVRALLWVAP